MCERHVGPRRKRGNTLRGMDNVPTRRIRFDERHADAKSNLHAVRFRNLRERRKSERVHPPRHMRAGYGANCGRHGNIAADVRGVRAWHVLRGRRDAESRVPDGNVGPRRKRGDFVHAVDVVLGRAIRLGNRLEHNRSRLLELCSWLIQHDGKRVELLGLDLLPPGTDACDRGHRHIRARVP